MTTSKNQPVKITKTTSHDRLSISAKFKTGAKFKWTITRNGESVEIGFSNDPKIASQQHRVVSEYMAQLTGTNSDKIDALENLMKDCKSGAEVVGKMLDKIKLEANNNN